MLVSGHGVAEEGPHPGAVNGAFRGVDLEPQPLGQESRDRRHHPLAGPPRPHIDVAVVGVTAEGMASSLELLVQVVEQDV